MQLEITQPFFEHCVPAFQTSDDQIFTRLQSYFDDTMIQLEILIGSTADAIFAEYPVLENLAKKYVCTHASRVAIPQLDLVLTQTGFGIVSTSNVAPASRDRVQALTEQLRKSESLTYDSLFSNLIALTAWKETRQCAEMVHSLLWNATIVRNAGVTLQGDKIFQDEFLQLQPMIYNAENALTDICGCDMYRKLVKSLRQPCDRLPDNYLQVKFYCEQFLVAYITENAAVESIGKKLAAYLEEFADEFPEYKNSSIYKANHVERYENTKESKCHFW